MVGNDREGTEKIGRVAATTPVNRRKNNSNNAVLSTIPLYTLSLYRMPDWLQTQIIRKFLLNGLGMGRKGYHLVAWDQVCKEKKRGLGIKRLERMNTSLLLKWWWKLASEPNHSHRSVKRKILLQKRNILAKGEEFIKLLNVLERANDTEKCILVGTRI